MSDFRVIDTFHGFGVMSDFNPYAYFDEVTNRNTNGTLTVWFAPFSYLLLLEGDYMGRVVIKTGRLKDSLKIVERY